MSETINNLVIVESPAKAKTIAGYLGSDFVVKSSVGHIRSIAKKPAKGQRTIDTDHDFETIYEIDPEKKKTVADLKKSVKSAQTVWLATDEDREGEAIAWHLCEVLGLDPAKTNRIVFHEITKNAIQEAVKNPRHIDMSLVRAQQARQILDRLVGFELSPVVWRKVPGGKSAGRVQSPAVRLLVEREREITAFESSFVFKVSAEFNHDGETFKATLSDDFPTETAAREFLSSLINANFTVANTETKSATRNPLPPFTTSTLQQDANARLGYAARTTMSLAQGLYQSGLITYMRTDSLNLSGQALAQITDHIKSKFGANYHQIRTYKTKSAGAQEAHEAIRPTDINREAAGDDPRAQKLYDLIRRRTLASQMASAKLDRTTVNIEISGRSQLESEDRQLGRAATSVSDDQVGDKPPIFTAKGEVVVFDGFLKVYGTNKEELLPQLKSGDKLSAETVTARQTFAKPPARYSEGSLVKKLEELGIGRPSTYATIIGTIQTRGYAEKGDGEGVERDVIEISLQNNQLSDQTVTEKTGSTKGKLVPTASGLVVSDFLNDYFTDIVDYDFTANVESELDEIASDKLDKVQMLREFYEPFHQKIDQSSSIDRAKVAQARELGTDPKSGEIVLARMGRFGPMLQMGNGDDDKKPRFANMPKGASLETVTLEQALEMFKLPRTVGTTADGHDILANIGRFGPYIKIGALFVSIKPLDPLEITETEARELYEKKLADEASKNIAEFDNGIKILRGRFGPYITDGKKNAKIPKGQDPAKITAEQALQIINEAPTKSKKPRRTKK